MGLTSHTHSLPPAPVHTHPHAPSHILTTYNDHLWDYSRALSQPASPHIASLRSERPHQQHYTPPVRMSDPPRRWARVIRVVCIGERGREMSEVRSTPTITERSTQMSVGDETNSGWRASNACSPVHTYHTPTHITPTALHLVKWHDAIVGFDS